MSAHELPPLPPLPPPDERNVSLLRFGWYTTVPGFYYPESVDRLRREAYELGAALNAQQAGEPTPGDANLLAEQLAAIAAKDQEIAELRRQLEAARANERHYRGTLQELRIRLHAAGRRPEECYEMSLIDAAIDKQEIQ